MMKFFAKIAIVAVVISACEKVESFPPEPHIEYISYEIVDANVNPEVPGQHVIMKFSFTDGDGDIGLDDSEVSPPFCDTCAHYDNLYVNLNSKLNGVFEKTYDYNSRIKNITPDAQNTTLEGTMTYKIDIANRASDTILIDFYIEDRALNKSNLQETPVIYVDL